MVTATGPEQRLTVVPEVHGESVHPDTEPESALPPCVLQANTRPEHLYREWLPSSGEEARDFPLYCQRLAFFPEVPEHEAIAELFLPLK